MALYLPIDAVTGSSIDVDLASDFLELEAYFAEDSVVRTSNVANGASVGAGEDYVDLQNEMREGEEEIICAAVRRIEARERALGSAYPFSLDAGGDVLAYEVAESFGRATYILSLVLSNLRAVTPVLNSSGLHPDEAEVRRLRADFQCCATVALAAEVHGNAWSFGSPRLDGSAFFGKLEEIWQRLGDGLVKAQIGAPGQPKDDQVDVFAARTHPDRLPGFPLVAAQVATGANWRKKSLKGHLDAFRGRWFVSPPVTKFIPYMVVPFARPDDDFLDDVRLMGNVLHRLRVPRRVAEAAELVKAGVTIEGYGGLSEIVGWVSDYRNRAGAAT